MVYSGLCVTVLIIEAVDSRTAGFSGATRFLLLCRRTELGALYSDIFTRVLDGVIINFSSGV